MTWPDQVPAVTGVRPGVAAEKSGNEDPVPWLRLAAASMYLQMDLRDIGEARRRLLEAASAVDPVGMPLHHRESLVLRCQPAFHEGRFDEATTLSARLGEDPEGVGGQDRARLEIPRNQPAIIAEVRAGAVVAMERLAKEARGPATSSCGPRSGAHWRSPSRT
ncbi:hypothetical protein K7B10_25805 [Streptomyces flavotricini]|uniref:Uncharacterized protein n=1 Tax=Streptomyces flavotricini TaxID=66888 RepID=A0ABS8EAF4_9ACTN|nr:hypothetical protein [Streptomyces flavotricini]MCC0098127.1 hypothetical protein [Streptomyces flavotricini]